MSAVSRPVDAVLDEVAARRVQGRHGEARDVLIAALADERTPRDRARLLYELGVVERELGAPEQARARFRDALTADPDARRAGLAWVELRMQDAAPVGDDDDLVALADYAGLGHEPATKRRVHEVLRQRLEVRLGDDAERVEKLVPILERLQGECPEMDYPKLFLGRAYYVRGEWRRAVDLLASVSAGALAQIATLNVIGRCHEKLGELGPAAAAYQRSLEADRAQPGILFRLGRLRLLQAQTS